MDKDAQDTPKETEIEAAERDSAKCCCKVLLGNPSMCGHKKGSVPESPDPCV